MIGIATAAITASFLYAQTFYVTEVVPTPTETIVVCQDFNGLEWKFISEDEDWYKGDIVSAIMDSKGTEIIFDDEFVTVKYSGYLGGIK